MSAFNDADIDSITNLVFSADPLSRFQHEKVYGVEKGSADNQALRALMLAVLEDGIACFQGRLNNERLFQEAEEWISSKDEGVFSFNTICETLGLDPGRLRKGLEQWKAKQIRAPLEARKRLILSKGKCAGKNIEAA